LDFLLTIAVGAAWSIVALMTLRDPERNRMTRMVDRWTEMWAAFPLSAPRRVQLWAGVIVGGLIAVSAFGAMVVQLVQGDLR
jgi:hypothetical protein